MSGKTNVGLVEFCESKLGTPYVYGAKMEVVTEAKYNALKKQYGSGMVWDSDAAKIGKTCCDCSGLISAYTGVMRGSSQYKDSAKGVYTINTISSAPVGALVWKNGHIGVYVGMENGQPMYIAEDGSALGCRKARLPGVFTHWFLCVDVDYQDAAGQNGTQTAKSGHGGTEAAKSGHSGTGAAIGGHSGHDGVAVGDIVTIKPGAAYGGLSADRGKDVPASVIGRSMTVDKIAVHRSVTEARLTEIFSWVAVDGLEKIGPLAAAGNWADMGALAPT